MNVFILTDHEGIAGVADIEYVFRGSEKYAAACKLFSKSINCAAEAAFDAGLERIDARTLSKTIGRADTTI